MPDSVDIPEPVSATTFREDAISLATLSNSPLNKPSSRLQGFHEFTTTTAPGQ